MQVADLATEPRLIDPDATLADAEAAMRLTDAHQLPVARRRLLGMLSLRDLQLAEPPSFDDRSRWMARTRAATLMRAPAIAARPDTTAVAAIELMVKYRLATLPLVEGDVLIAQVARGDLVRYLLDSLRDRLGSVSQVMSSPPVIVVESDDRLHTAELLMRHAMIRHLPVVRGRQLVGLLHDSDVFAAISSGHRGTVAEVMRHCPPTVDPDTTAERAGRMLIAARPGALPVLKSRRLCGMLTEYDFLVHGLGVSAA